ncbi:MAG TPA: DUF892 family protein [Bryobacteraceae bacterium]|nr:DUF892 family protein [Bryobacteraceae bacterium]
MDQALYNLFIQEAHLLLGAEHEQSARLRELSEFVKTEELRMVFEQHALETEEQITRLEDILTTAGEHVEGEIPAAMDGLIDDAELVSDQDLEIQARDIAVATAARKMEHYEIGCYQSLIALADSLSLGEAAGSLRISLKEEEQADHRIAHELRRLSLDMTSRESQPAGLAELL